MKLEEVVRKIVKEAEDFKLGRRTREEFEAQVRGALGEVLQNRGGKEEW